MQPGLMKVFWMVATWQGVVIYKENLERANKYEAAKSYAAKVRKPLLVVGGALGSPMNAILGLPNHGQGDVCLDLSAAACQGAPETRIADVRTIPYPNRYFGAAFVSHVLEHLPTVADAELAIAELRRVAEALFVASPTKQGLRNWLHSEHHLWVEQRPDGTIALEQR